MLDVSVDETIIYQMKCGNDDFCFVLSLKEG